MRTKEEIEEVLQKVNPYEGSKYPGMTYEEGVDDALNWVAGNTLDCDLAGDPYFDPDS